MRLLRAGPIGVLLALGIAAPVFADVREPVGSFAGDGAPNAVRQAPTTVTLSPIKDNTLYESGAGDISNGAGQHIFAGRTASPGLIRRGLVAFDIASAVPAGATIDGASLTLHMSRTSFDTAQTVELRKLLADWGEGTSDALAMREGGRPPLPAMRPGCTGPSIP